MMKCDLYGLLNNAATQLHREHTVGGYHLEMGEYYELSLREVANHIMQVRRGECTVEEFCQHYLIGGNLGPVKRNVKL